VRVGGTLIWATRFEEDELRRAARGAKGGPRVDDLFSYYANAAFALCEGADRRHEAHLGGWARDRPGQVTRCGSIAAARPAPWTR
jgi:hypothetical protein